MERTMEKNEQIESCLGRPEVLVAAALANRRQASVFGRHPIVSFVVAPIPAAILSWIGFLWVCFGVLKIVGWAFGDEYAIEGRAVRDWPAVLIYAVNAMVLALRFLPPAVVTVLLCWCANRAGMSWRWTLTASCLVALIASVLVVQATLPVEPGQGKFLLGLQWPVQQWINLIQLLAPMAVATVFLFGARNRVVAKA